MAENKFSSSEDHRDSESAEMPMNIHERAVALQKKVGELSKAFEGIERDLAEAAGERPDCGA
jgi:hypothetical protein